VRSAATDADALVLARRTRAVPPGTPPVTLSSLGQVTWPLRVAHVEWSPHVSGEAALILEDGALHAYDVARALAAAAAPRTLPKLRGACACARARACVASLCVCVFLRMRTRRRADVRSCANATRAAALSLARAGTLVCAADGSARGWRGACYGAHPRTLVCASPSSIWLADARAPPPAPPKALHALSRGRPTLERLTAVCSAGVGAGCGFLFAAASGARVLLFDARRAADPLLSWEHALGDADPPRLLSCQAAAPWLRAEAPSSSSSSAPGAAGRVLLACTLARREALCFQFAHADAPPRAAADALGWAGALLRCRGGVRALGAGARVPCPAAADAPARPWHVRGVYDDGDGDPDARADAAGAHGRAWWSLSDPPCAGFALLPPRAPGGRGLVCAADGAARLSAVLCAHAPVGTGAPVGADAADALALADAAACAVAGGAPGAAAARPRGAQPLARSTLRKRVLGEAARAAWRMPLHFALLAPAAAGDGDSGGGDGDGDDDARAAQDPGAAAARAARAARPQEPPPPATAFVGAAQRALWPLTRLEAAHAAVAGAARGGAGALLADSALLTAAAQAPAGQRRVRGKTVAASQRRAVVAAMLAGARDAAAPPLCLLPLPDGDGDSGSGSGSAAAGVLSAAQAALRAASSPAPHAAFRDGALGTYALPRRAAPAPLSAQPAAGVTRQRAPDALFADGLHCAAFRAAWACCEEWRLDGEDPFADVFFPLAPHDASARGTASAAGASAAQPAEPLLLLPPRARDADDAALEVRIVRVVRSSARVPSVTELLRARARRAQELASRWPSVAALAPRPGALAPARTPPRLSQQQPGHAGVSPRSRAAAAAAAAGRQRAGAQLLGPAARTAAPRPPKLKRPRAAGF
jgi:hypothetical protein